jgi:acyl-CoA synthetase
MHSEPSDGPSRRHTDPADAVEYRRKGWWGDRSLGDYVAANARTSPGGAAFVADGHRFTWADYDAASDRVADTLIALGSSRLDRVAVLLPDSATVHAAFIGAERAGVTVVGIGARAGDREIGHLLARTSASTLISSSDRRGEPTTELVERLVSAGTPIGHHVVLPRFESEPDAAIRVNGRPLEADAAPADGNDRALGPDDLFLINSTSGTTGLPKCVMHNQNRWMYFHQKAVEHGRLTSDDVFYGAVPSPFGFGLWTAHFTPCILGSPTVVADRFDATAALAAIERERVSVLCCVSTQFLMMLNDPTLARRDLSALRVMFTGGEAVPHGRAREFEDRTGCTVLQFFGSNETGLLSGTKLDDPRHRRLRSAGRIVPEMNVRLFDGDRDVTASGKGQPACRGPATSFGYLDDDSANAELFTPDGWMRMGDLCTIDDDGDLTVTGRTSDIIIRGGKNISAAQVEDEVSTHPSVALAAAVAWPDETFGERVCVYVELRESTHLDLDGLVGHLRRRGVSMELYPEHLVVVPELPRSSGGKVAKGELREDAARRAG